MKHVAPNVICRIISSANGPRGHSVGRKCRVVQRQPGEHSVWGPIWQVESIDGREFASEHGGIGMNVDCAEDWLEPLDDEPPKQETRTKELELTE